MDSLLFVCLLLRCFGSLLCRHYRKIGRKIGQGRRKKLNLRGPAIKKSNGIKYITRRSRQILNTGIYRKIFRDFSLDRWAIVWEFSIAHPIFHSPWATGRVGVFIPGAIVLMQTFCAFTVEKILFLKILTEKLNKKIRFHQKS